MSESIRYNYMDLVSINSTVASSVSGSVSNTIISNFTSGTLYATKVGSTLLSVSNLLVGASSTIGGYAAMTNYSISSLDLSSTFTCNNATCESILVSSGSRLSVYSSGSVIVSGYSSIGSLNSTLCSIGGIVASGNFNFDSSTITNFLYTNSCIANLQVLGSISSGNSLATSIRNTGDTSFGTLVSLGITTASCIITNVTTGYTGTLLPNVNSITLGDIATSLATLANSNISGFTSSSSITNINMSGLSTIGNIFPPSGSVSNTSIQNCTVASIYSNPGSITHGTLFVSSITSIPFTSQLRILTTENDAAKSLEFYGSRNLLNNFSITNNTSNIWIGTSTGNVNIASVGPLDTRGSTLTVQSSSGGSSAFINCNGVVTITNSTNSTDSSNGGSFTTYGGASITRNMIIGGSLTKGSGTFDIQHPIKEGYRLRHSFVESPNRGDNLYRYNVLVEKCKEYTLCMPEYFNHLNDTVQVFVRPIWHFGIGYGTEDKSGNAIKIVCDTSGMYNILIVASRCDIHAVNGWDRLGLEYLH